MKLLPGRTVSARTLLRAFQTVRGGTPDPGFMADLAFVQHKDLDLSVRLSGMLAFDALSIAAAINPITASPGAPLSLDAARQPLEVVVVALGLVLLVVSAFNCVRAVLIGEEFEVGSIEENADALSQRLFAAYCVSVDKQAALLRQAILETVAGVGITFAVWAWILLDKM